MHKDSLGTEMEITPGAVNWMTAGKGIVHSERTPQYLRSSDKYLHGLQIWVALPKELEQMEPSFQHTEKTDLPAWEQDGVSFKLIAGKAFGKQSPVAVYSPLYFIEIKSTAKQTINIGHELFGESAIYILEGYVESEGIVFEPKHFLVAKNSSLCEFIIGENTTIYIFGGEPLPEERFIQWNFVASSKELIEDARQRWLAQTFPKVPGETEFVPLPDSSPKKH